jgi:signal transduction histidine kinase
MPWPEVTRQLDALSHGYAKLPIRLTLHADSESVHEIGAVLLHGFTTQDVLLVLHDDADAAAYRNVTQNLFQFLRTGLRESVDALANAAGSIARQLPVRQEGESLAEAVIQTRASATELAGRLEKLEMLGDLIAHDRLQTDERIVVSELIDAAWNKVSAIAQAAEVNLSTVGVTADLPPVYGSMAWLLRALSELLENAIRASGRKTNVEVAANQSSLFLHITVRDFGHSPVPRKHGRHYLPFVDAVPATGTASQVRKKSAVPPPKGVGVGLALVERVLELHGGHLRVGDARDDSTAFVMDLPTGAPTQVAGGLELQQAQRYAVDMAALLARQAAARAAAR